MGHAAQESGGGQDVCQSALYSSAVGLSVLTKNMLDHICDQQHLDCNIFKTVADSSYNIM